jgi:hypothetical protein
MKHKDNSLQELYKDELIKGQEFIESLYKGTHHQIDINGYGMLDQKKAQEIFHTLTWLLFRSRDYDKKYIYIGYDVDGDSNSHWNKSDTVIVFTDNDCICDKHRTTDPKNDVIVLIQNKRMLNFIHTNTLDLETIKNKINKNKYNQEIISILALTDFREYDFDIQKKVDSLKGSKGNVYLQAFIGQDLYDSNGDIKYKVDKTKYNMGMFWSGGDGTVFETVDYPHEKAFKLLKIIN